MAGAAAQRLPGVDSVVVIDGNHNGGHGGDDSDKF